MSDVIDVRKVSLAWLDDSTNDSEDNLFAQEYFRTLDGKFKRLKSRTEYDEYMKTQPADARISLITNGRLGQQIVPDIHSSTQIDKIYVYCMDKIAHEKWAKNYSKVLIIFSQ
jgi:hypothetical protein